jgi:nucleoside-diphosphate-sugar epimerase
MNRAQVMAAAERVDAIVHAVSPPSYGAWAATVLPMAENTLAAAEAVGARIILPGTIYNFDVASTPIIDADTPQHPRTGKGRIRVQLEALLEEAAPQVRSLIIRAGDYFGAEARSSWFSKCLVEPGRTQRRLLNPARGPGHTWAYLPDFAEAIVGLMEIEDRLAAFERVQFAGYFDQTGQGMIDAVRAAVGRNIPERAFPWWLMRLMAPFGGFPGDVAEIATYWCHPAHLDNRRLVELLGSEPHTLLPVAVAQTLQGLDALDQSAAGAVRPFVAA